MSANYEEEAAEVVQMWTDDEYDNFKDVIMDCVSLLEQIPDADQKLRSKVMAVLVASTTEAQEMVDDDPSMADYMEGLIEPAYLSAEYRAAHEKG